MCYTNRTMKKLISIMLILVICVSAVSCGGGSSNSDAKPVINAAEKYLDVDPGDWYEESVSWGVSEGIIQETKPDLFGATTAMTKAQIILTMWKAAGAPGRVVSAKSVPDSDPNSDFSKAVAWGLEKGVIKINSDYSSTDIASRLEAIEFMWKEAESPSVNSNDNFEDTPNNVAVSWAKLNGITYGIGHNLFGPDLDCTKSQMITFLFRAK